MDTCYRRYDEGKIVFRIVMFAPGQHDVIKHDMAPAASFIVEQLQV